MSNQPTPCPGCEVRQHGARVNSMLRRSNGTKIKICRACGQYESLVMFRKGGPLQGVGKNGTPPNHC